MSPPGQRQGLFSDQENVSHVFLEHAVGILREALELVVPQQSRSSGIHHDLFPHGPRWNLGQGDEQTKVILSVML